MGKDYTNRGPLDYRFQMRMSDKMLEVVDNHAVKINSTRSWAVWDLIQKGIMYEEAVNKL